MTTPAADAAFDAALQTLDDAKGPSTAPRPTPTPYRPPSSSGWSASPAPRSTRSPASTARPATTRPVGGRGCSTRRWPTARRGCRCAASRSRTCTSRAGGAFLQGPVRLPDEGQPPRPARGSTGTRRTRSRSARSPRPRWAGSSPRSTSWTCTRRRRGSGACSRIRSTVGAARRGDEPGRPAHHDRDRGGVPGDGELDDHDAGPGETALTVSVRTIAG